MKHISSFLTPSNKYEAPEVFGVWSEGHEDETVEVEAFHQDPVVVGGQKINEQQHCHLAANLMTKVKRFHYILFIQSPICQHAPVMVSVLNTNYCFLWLDCIWQCLSVWIRTRMRESRLHRKYKWKGYAVKSIIIHDTHDKWQSSRL